MSDNRVSHLLKAELALMDALAPALGRILPPSERAKFEADHLHRQRQLQLQQMFEDGEIEYCQTCEARHLVFWNRETEKYEPFHAGSRTFLTYDPDYTSKTDLDEALQANFPGVVAATDILRRYGASSLAHPPMSPPVDVNEPLDYSGPPEGVLTGPEDH